MNKYLDTTIKKIVKKNDYITHIITDQCTLALEETYLGTYKNDNVKKLKKELYEGQIIDIIFAQEQWWVNTFPYRKLLNQRQTLELNDESKVI